MRRLIFILLLFAVSITQAQTDSASDGWEIVERCIGEPTTPPDDWSYDGTILMWGDSGLHGVRTEWETPRILAFLPSNADIDSKLSPSGRYFALVNREFIPNESSPTGFSGIEASGITIYDITVNAEPIFEISIENTYGITNRDWSIRQLRWLDETHIVYEVSNNGEQAFNLDYVKIFDITTGNQTAWEYPVNPVDNHNFYPSPDLRYAIQGITDFSLFSIMTNEIVLEAIDVDLRRETLGIVEWSLNSQSAVIVTRNDKANIFKIIMIETSGNFDSIISIPVGDSSIFPKIAISPNGQNLAYFHETLHIVDLETQIIIDTCISSEINSLIWSPNSTQVAYYLRGAVQQPVTIYDLEENQAFTVGYHSSSYFDPLLGWRAD